MQQFWKIRDVTYVKSFSAALWISLVNIRIKLKKQNASFKDLQEQVSTQDGETHPTGTKL